MNQCDRSAAAGTQNSMFQYRWRQLASINERFQAINCNFIKWCSFPPAQCGCMLRASDAATLTAFQSFGRNRSYLQLFGIYIFVRSALTVSMSVGLHSDWCACAVWKWTASARVYRMQKKTRQENQIACAQTNRQQIWATNEVNCNQLHQYRTYARSLHLRFGLLTFAEWFCISRLMEHHSYFVRRMRSTLYWPWSHGGRQR